MTLGDKGHIVGIVGTPAEARALVNRPLPIGKSIFAAASETLRLSGLDDDINASGR